jgi:hypothetical protein
MDRQPLDMKPAPAAAHTPAMRKNLLRFVLLKLLPGRLIPFLTVFEVLMLIRRLRAKPPAPVAPRRVVTSTPPRPKVTVTTDPVPSNARPVTPP